MAAPNFRAVTYKRPNPLPDGVELRFPPITADEDIKYAAFKFPVSIQSLKGPISRAFLHGGTGDICHVTYDSGHEAGQIDIDGQARNFGETEPPPTHYYTVDGERILYFTNSSIPGASSSKTTRNKRSIEESASNERKRARTTVASSSRPPLPHQSTRNSHRTRLVSAQSPAPRPSPLTQGFNAWRGLNPSHLLPRTRQTLTRAKEHIPASSDLNRDAMNGSRGEQKQMTTIPPSNRKRPALEESLGSKTVAATERLNKEHGRKRSRLTTKRRDSKNAQKHMDTVRETLPQRNDNKDPSLPSLPTSSTVADVQIREPASGQKPPIKPRSRPASKIASDVDVPNGNLTSNEAANTTLKAEQRNSISRGGAPEGNQLTLRNVSKKSSDQDIEHALVEFHYAVQGTEPIRTTEEENIVREYWGNLHALYTEVDRRLERIMNSMEDLKNSYEQPRSRVRKRQLEMDIRNAHEKYSRQHKKYVEYLPKLHKEVKKTLGRLDEWFDSWEKWVD